MATTPAFLPGEFHGLRNLAGYIPQGLKESDTTEVTQHAKGCFETERMSHGSVLVEDQERGRLKMFIASVEQRSPVTAAKALSEEGWSWKADWVREWEVEYGKRNDNRS